MSTVAWWGYGITLAVLLLLLVGMFVMIKAMTDESGQYEEVKQMIEALFHTPSFLRPGVDSPESGTSRQQTVAAAVDETFVERCPGCQETVTHENPECPSCGLRLL
jgi:predicted metal-dependent enzyme (double-stranded beta helix superfamily)